MLAELEARAAVLEGCLGASLQVSWFRVEVWTLQLTPSTLTDMFAGLRLKPEPVIVKS